MSRPRGYFPQLLARTAIALTATYAIAIGGTFNGVLNVPLQQTSLLFLTVGVVGWLVFRPRPRFHTFSWSQFDLVLLLWSAAYVIATVAHPSGRTYIGLWYAGLYAGLWFIMSDLRQRGLSERWIIHGVLFVSVPLMLIAVVQVIPWFWAWFTLDNVDVVFAPPRPPSLLGNPNMLGTVLAVLLPFGLVRSCWAPRYLDQLIWRMWTVVDVSVLYLTYSRGAWLAAVSASLTLGVLILHRFDRLHPLSWLVWWRERSRRGRLVLVGLGLISIVLVGIFLFVTLKAFNTPRRETSFRLSLYQIAWQEFRAHPLTGTGPFTFGRSILEHDSIPPDQPHAHAHNVVLNVASEMGVPGLVALIFTVVLIVWRGWGVLRLPAGDTSEWAQYAACSAALVAFGVHSLFDMTLMVPGIMLLLLSILGCVVVHPAKISHKAGIDVLTSGVVIILWGGVLATGWWSSLAYGDYVDGERLLIAGEYQAGADILQQTTKRQSFLALYHAEYGYARGLAAFYGDPDSLQAGIGAYKRALELEAPHAVWWTNLAALYGQAGQSERATEAMRQAVRYAPDDADIWLNLGMYYEQQGYTSQAQETYRQVLELEPAWGHANFWTETELRRMVLQMYPVEPTPYMRAWTLWQAGQPEAALAVLEEMIDHDPVQPRPYSDIARLYVAAGQLDRAQDYLDAARVLVHLDHDLAWIRFIEAELALARGDQREWQNNVRTARDLIWPDNTGNLVLYGREIANFQFLRLTVKGTFLPQVTTLRPDPILVDLLRAN